MNLFKHGSAVCQPGAVLSNRQVDTCTKPPAQALVYIFQISYIVNLLFFNRVEFFRA